METTEEIDHQSMTERGRRWVVGGLVCAALSLTFAPVVLMPLGVVAGAVAVWKGARWWGTAVISASAVTGVVGYYLAAGLAT